MKTTLRAFALSLVVTGAVASIHTQNNAAPVVTSSSVVPPIPMCPPNDPNGCNIQSIGK